MADYLILPHEHIFCRYRSADKPRAVKFVRAQIEQLGRHGVTDVVDLTTYTNPLSYLDFLESSPVRVHPCVGFYLERYVRKAHRALPVEDLVRVLERKRKRLSPTLPPVAIKVATHSESLFSFECRAFDAAAMFHQRTGLPIITHSPHGFEQHLDYLLNRGVSKEAIMLSHPEMSIKGRFPISGKTGTGINGSVR